jgi:hypothetical protein
VTTKPVAIYVDATGEPLGELTSREGIWFGLAVFCPWT